MNTHTTYYFPHHFAERSPVTSRLWHWLTTHSVGQFIAAFLLTTGFTATLALMACGLWTVCPIEVSISVRMAQTHGGL